MKPLNYNDREKLRQFTALMNNRNVDEGDELVICAKFGCNKILTSVEQFAGNYCTKHQIEYNQQQRQNAKSHTNENNGFPL